MEHPGERGSGGGLDDRRVFRTVLAAAAAAALVTASAVPVMAARSRPDIALSPAVVTPSGAWLILRRRRRPSPPTLGPIEPWGPAVPSHERLHV